MSKTMKDSGIPWIGEIPSHWRQYRIKHNTFLKGRIGWQGLSSNDFIDEGYCLITGTDFDNKGGIHWETCYRISKERFDEDELLHVKEGDLLMTKDGTVGKMAYIKNLSEEASLNSHLLIIRQVSPFISNSFLYWVMISDIFKGFIGVYQTGTIMSSISQSTLGYFSCYCPPIPEQQAIADFLDKKCSEIDEMVSLQEKIVEELRAYKQSVITEAVCKGLNPDVPMKDSGIEWIGQIPEHWNIYRIKYNTFLKGRIGWQGLNSNDFLDEGYCLITGTDFDNKGSIHWETCYRISKERFDEDELLHVKNGDLLMTKDGTVGKMAYIKNLPEEASLNSHLLIIRQITPLIKNAFLYWAMLSEEFKGFCSIYQSGSIMNSVSQSTLGAFSCSCPPLEEQQAIADFLDKKCAEIDALISLKQSKIDALKDYKKSIIYEYITGKKEIPYGD